MSQDRELEIRLQFLDEAQEYLATLESAVMGLSNSGVDVDRINAALRAAHSIKGGAGMMGYDILSHLAHRLEDSFKVLKIQRQTIEIDAALEGLLLSGVDCLNQVIEGDRQNIPPDPDWLGDAAAPIFEQLYERLGEPQAEDASSMLAPEDGQDVLRLLFETEVDGCLQRLESVLESRDPCLREEVEILAQELGGLGEMLQLQPFIRLCESVTDHLVAAPEQVEEIAELALAAWRRSQALVLTEHLDTLPTAIKASFAVAPRPIAAPIEESAAVNWIDFEETEEPVFDSVDAAVETHHESTFNLQTQAEEYSEQIHESARERIDEQVSEPIAKKIDLADTVNAATVLQPHTSRRRRIPDLQITEVVPDLPQHASTESPESTVRVPSKQLDQLNDLFGELTIERNALDLHLGRLHSLVQALSHRVQILDQSNVLLRDSYDTVAPNQNLEMPATQSNGKTRASDNRLPSDEYLQNAMAQLQDLQGKPFDALEMDRYSNLHLLSQEVMETIVQIQEVTTDIELSLDDSEQTARNLNKTSRQLQNKLTKLRMRPLSDVLDRFPRALRELSLQHGKPVQLKVGGGNTLVDRNILEALNDPLMHILRNAFDHGIEAAETRAAQGKPEEGLIEICAAHRNNRTVITVRDDGGGIPLNKVRAKARQMGLDEVLLAAASEEDLLSLIFEPGFSTSDQVTALSGRGVGMDVVRDRLKQIQGEITVATEPGKGTTFTLSVPFTLTVSRVLIAESNRMLLAFPIDLIEEMVLLPAEQVMLMAGSEVFNWEGLVVQLIRLAEWLEFNCPRQLDGMEAAASVNVPTVLMLNQGNQVVGLEIDRSWGEQEVAIRKVEGLLSMPPGFSNCTILGDGRIVPLVDISELLRWIASSERARVDSSPARSHLPPASSPRPSVVHGDRHPTILVVDDSINVRRFLALTLEKAGYQVAQAKDGQDALDKLSAGLTVQAIVCDIEMPRLDGFGFLARFKADSTFEQIPVTMLTSRSGEKHRQLAMSLGATAYFSKPYNEQALLQTLKQLIAV
ncbi:MAG: response regulator [Timaviella obliquedivisa GSE-PSE-MK23-08B]|jgi:chemosensory pili system protein ChpA (sensor histidine kinase/response regulator)|nr:response regulator [Timaviella obliquedivisa GSE-PSE-MK23-08B]